MGKLDLDKFICSIMNFSNVSCGVKYIISNALKEQGIRIVGDDIIEEMPNPKWYKCVKDYRGFIEGKLYCTNENGDLPSATGGKYVLAISNPFFKEWFRPATEEEIKEISGNNEEISPNCELTEFEKALKIIVNGFGGDVMTDVGAKNAGARLLDLARKEVLNGLPKWSKKIDMIESLATNCLRYDYFENDGFYLKITDLIDKLPKEE